MGYKLLLKQVKFICSNYFFLLIFISSYKNINYIHMKLLVFRRINSTLKEERKLSRIYIGFTRLTHGHLMLRNNQQPTCRNAACGNQSLTIKHCLKDCLQWKNSRKKHNIQSDIRTLLGKDCEVEKIMRFLNGIGMFEEI